MKDTVTHTLKLNIAPGYASGYASGPPPGYQGFFHGSCLPHFFISGNFVQLSFSQALNMERRNPLSLVQLSTIVIRENVHGLYQGVARLPVPLQRYIASCLEGYVRKYVTVLSKPEPDPRVKDLYKKYDGQIVYQCRLCRCIDHYCSRLVCHTRTIIAYRFMDSGDEEYVCFCCGKRAWEVDWTSNDYYLSSLVVLKAMDITCVREGSLHSTYIFFNKG